MNWNRAGLKQKGKMAFQANYWRCVLVAFILSLILGGTSGSSTVSNAMNEVESALDGGYLYEDYGFYEDYDFYEDYEDYDYDVYYSDYDPDSASYATEATIFGLIYAVLAVVFGAVALFGAALSIFLFLPMEVGGCRFFVENSYAADHRTGQEVSAGRLFFSFHKGVYWNTVKIMFLRSLYIALWSLLFVIPGIVKGYEYRMVPYLMADCPELSRKDAFRISKEMMMGQKFDTFVLDLSFLGWTILNAFTCGILGLLYVSPYRHATNAELFMTLKQQYLGRQQYGNPY